MLKFMRLNTQVLASPDVICNSAGDRYVDSGNATTTALVEIETNTRYIYISYSKDHSQTRGTDHVEIYDIKCSKCGFV